jgi:FolB domain-containing protein
MPKITITDLEVQFHVGVPNEERAKPQRLLLTIEMEHDFSAAAATDDITATIDYFDVSQKIITLGTGRSWRLIEKLASDVADLVLTGYRPLAVTVTVKKFPIPQAAQVSVSLTKHRA